MSPVNPTIKINFSLKKKNIKYLSPFIIINSRREK